MSDARTMITELATALGMTDSQHLKGGLALN